MTRQKTSPHVVTSFGAAATALRTSVDALKAIRDAGCPGFMSNGRIDISLVEDYISKNRDLETPLAGTSLKNQKTSEEIRKLRISNDAKDRLVVARSAVQSANSETARRVKDILFAKLENEYPSSVAGLDPAGARVKGKQLADSILVEFQKLGYLWEI